MILLRNYLSLLVKRWLCYPIVVSFKIIVEFDVLKYNKKKINDNSCSSRITYQPKLVDVNATAKP